MKVRIIISFALFLFAISPVSACRMLGVLALPGQSLSTRDSNGNLHLFLQAELEEFRLQGGSGSWPYSNRDGWGMTSYAPSIPLPEALTVRSEVDAYSDEGFIAQTSSLLERDGVTILIGHLRQTSSGANGIQNPHPFIFHDSNGNQFSFAHNGDLDKDVLRQLIGDEWLETHPPQTFEGGPWNGSGWSQVVDSELFFFWIMKSIEESATLEDGLLLALTTLENECPDEIKNFLFSDGQDLYAYRSSPYDDIYYFDGRSEEETPWYLEISNQRAIMSTPPPTGPLAEIPWIELADKHLLKLKADGTTEMIEPLIIVKNFETPNRPQSSMIIQAFPNPFNAGVTLSGYLTQALSLTLNIYNMEGKLVYHRSHEFRQPGVYHLFWSGKNSNGINLDSGSYIVVISGRGYYSKGKILLLK